MRVMLVCFTLQKETNGVKWCFTKKRGTHPLPPLRVRSRVRTRVEPYVSGGAPFRAQLGTTGGECLGFFGPSEPRSRCATLYILHFRWFGLLWWQFTIYCDFLGNVAAAWGSKRAKNTEKVDFPGLGAAQGETPADQFDRMLNADPVNPVWGSMCLWAARYGRFFLGGGWGPFVGWGPVLSVRDHIKKSWTRKIENFVDFFCCGPNKPIFVKTEWPLMPPIGAVRRTEKT